MHLLHRGGRRRTPKAAVSAAFDGVFATFVLAMAVVVVLTVRSAWRRDRAARTRASGTPAGPRRGTGLPAP